MVSVSLCKFSVSSSTLPLSLLSILITSVLYSVSGRLSPFYLVPFLVFCSFIWENFFVSLFWLSLCVCVCLLGRSCYVSWSWQHDLLCGSCSMRLVVQSLWLPVPDAAGMSHLLQLGLAVAHQWVGLTLRLTGYEGSHDYSCPAFVS